jgi:hypothetical protein
LHFESNLTICKKNSDTLFSTVYKKKKANVGLFFSH